MLQILRYPESVNPTVRGEAHRENRLEKENQRNE